MIFHSKVCCCFVCCYCPCILLVEGKGLCILYVLFCVKAVKSYSISCLGGLYCNVSLRNNTNQDTTTENKNRKCRIKKRNNADQSKNSNRHKQSAMKTEKINEINKINEELKHAKRALTELTKKLDIEKEINVKLNKKFEDQMNESEKQIATLKTVNLDFENKVNKKNMNNEPIAGKQDQQHQKQSNREISQKRTQEKHS